MNVTKNLLTNKKNILISLYEWGLCYKWFMYVHKLRIKSCVYETSKCMISNIYL